LVYGGGMSLAKFHRGLYGPEPNPASLKLYEAAEGNGIQGYDARVLDPDEFLASLALALHLTENQHRVYILVPKARQEQVLTQLKNVARQMIQARKDSPSGVQFVKDVFALLVMESRVLQFPDPPDRWVSIGFCSTDPLPEWMKGRLLGQ